MLSEMTRKERVIAALNHEPVDRVPTDYLAEPEMTQKLMKYLGAKDDIDFWNKLVIDKVVLIDPPFIGNRQNMWDITYKKIYVAGGQGSYDEPEFYPLGGLDTIDEIESKYEWPRPDMFDYSALAG